MTITPQELVNREVHYCVSFLVGTLAAGAGGAIRPRSGSNPYLSPLADLAEVCEQAMELAAPIDDWEEAAIQDGWSFVRYEADCMVFKHTDGRTNRNVTWGELCEEQGLEPGQSEVYEHWIVSDWLADKLIEHGEKVDQDFAGMTVWARTTTGQVIYADGLIERICAELVEA